MAAARQVSQTGTLGRRPDKPSEGILKSLKQCSMRALWVSEWAATASA